MWCRASGRALRYGIGVGRDGFQWQGLLKITRKQEWPDWTPPPEMIERQPYLPRWMAGGPGNPLGARALYLGHTVYRIHGTNQPQTIGSAVSSGCFRLVNADVIDLYDRIPVGTKVIVRQRPNVVSWPRGLSMRKFFGEFFGWNFRTGLLIGCVIAAAVTAAAITYERYDTKTLKRTVRRDAVFCGVNTGLPGFSSVDDKGNWSGFDVDFCRAIAAAIFDDPKKVKFVPLDAKERFVELGKRKVDVLARNSTWTMSRETEYYLHFAARVVL